MLPLGLYLGIILGYGRLYANNELHVIHAFGFSIRRLTVLTLSLGLIVSVIVAILMLWINPLIALKKDKLIAEGLSMDHMLETLVPGRFQVSQDGRRVVYVENLSRDRKKAHNIFIADQGKTEVSPWVVLS